MKRLEVSAMRIHNHSKAKQEHQWQWEWITKHYYAACFTDATKWLLKNSISLWDDRRLQRIIANIILAYAKRLDLVWGPHPIKVVKEKCGFYTSLSGIYACWMLDNTWKWSDGSRSSRGLNTEATPHTTRSTTVPEWSLKCRVPALAMGARSMWNWGGSFVARKVLNTLSTVNEAINCV